MSETTPTPGRTTFVDWLNTVLDELKATRQLSRRRAIGESGVPRGTVYRWLAGAIPDRDLVLQFCENLTLDIVEPFALLGWDPAGPSTSPVRGSDPVVMSRQVHQFEALLRDPDLLPDERERYEGMMAVIVRDLEATLERRRNEGT